MVRPAFVAEEAGIPSVAIVATSFLDLVHQLGVAEGVPEQRYAEYPGTFSVESEGLIKERIEKKTFDQIVEALTKPAGKSRMDLDGTSNHEDIRFAGTLEEISESFRNNKLTDGLPIILPTADRVEKFLKYTDRSPDEQVAILPPGNLRATPSNIAANGVMAGCRPEHMPLLMAAVEAISDPHYNLVQLGTTGGINPFLLINGPIIQKLGLVYDIGLVSRGPNPSIGRALGLIIRNIANLRPAEQYMGTFGYIMPFVIAEDEERSPWEPFHVEQGFDRNTSTLTACGTMNWGFQGFPSGNDPEGHLKIICHEIVRNYDLYGPVNHGPLQMMTVLITPSVAEAIARGGYSKEAVNRYLFEHSRVSIGEISFVLKHGYALGGSETIRSLIEKGSGIPKEWGNLGPEDMVPVLAYPGVVRVVVCGDRTRNKVMALHAAYVRPTTKEIRAPRKLG